MPPIASAALGIAMLAAFLLAGVGITQVRKPDRAVKQRGWLMIAMAVILVANVAIWTI
ncbi:hypothetical protein [Sphingomicrobium aestuariivivum]|uniref:hypothetical protein n=1 Tax=Sphingomicrobium aestuariivivum TaxID=1582356 RepID=UPI001FD6E288|nr:hypothetical protein [Sphingomicrobium aestuariivivum]MCJ8189878.1 hypothetical protein [Sphingomicrobium aestuariivivum]